MLPFEMIDYHIDKEDFNIAFWDWWDKLPKDKRDLFNYSTNDWAKINFFNSVYRHIN